MNAQEFAYWLNGFVELTNTDTPPTLPQWKMIKEHLKLVFHKVTPEQAQTTDAPERRMFYVDVGTPPKKDVEQQQQVIQSQTQDIMEYLKKHAQGQKDFGIMTSDRTPPVTTPFEYPPYDPFKSPQPSWLFPGGYDPSKTMCIC